MKKEDIANTLHSYTHMLAEGMTSATTREEALGMLADIVKEDDDLRQGIAKMLAKNIKGQGEYLDMTGADKAVYTSKMMNDDHFFRQEFTQKNAIIWFELNKGPICEHDIERLEKEAEDFYDEHGL